MIYTWAMRKNQSWFSYISKRKTCFTLIFTLSILVAACYMPFVASGSSHNRIFSNRVFDNSLANIYLPIIIKPSIYYVSRSGNNQDGKTWATAWNDLDQIDWNVIKPGDTILLDGGQSQMVYGSTLSVKKSGTPEAPIYIQLSGEPDRNGRAVIFGGRSTPLPYCGQTSYAYQTQGVREDGIYLDGVSWIVIDGLKWRGITIYGNNRDGIRLHHNPSDISISNVEIYDNGWASKYNNQWEPDGPGVDFTGTNIKFTRMIIHDNGQDAFQSAGGNHNFTLRQSWLYNLRTNNTGEKTFNWCQHSDGIQIYDGGTQSGFFIEESIFGPGFMQGVILGQSTTSTGQSATINNVTFRNDVFSKAERNNMMGYPTIHSQGWVIDHVTIYSPKISGTTVSSIFLEGSGHTVTNTIVHSGNIYLPDGLAYKSGNCPWSTTGYSLGTPTNPLFISISTNPLSLDNYALKPGSPCVGKGSSITSVDQLLHLPNTN
jgi:hypothetical protein